MQMSENQVEGKQTNIGPTTNQVDLKRARTEIVFNRNNNNDDDTNSIRRYTLRKPLTQPSMPVGSSQNSKNPPKTTVNPTTSSQEGGDNSRIGKFRRGLVHSRMRLFSTEFKLLIQFIIIFLSYFIYSISNIILTYQLTVTEDNRWDKDLLKVFRLLIWTYHLFNPIIFLSFHPIFLNKCVKSPDGPCKINAAISCCLQCL